MKKSLQVIFAPLLAMLLMLASFGAHAAGPDLTSLTSQVDFSTVAAAILAVAGSIVGVYLTWKGAKMVIQAVKGA